MRRRSERGKTKPTPDEESPEKPAGNSKRHSRRRRKSSSSEGESKSPVKSVDTVSQPLEIQVQDIELPQGDNPIVPTNNDEPPQKPETQEGWKEDSSFWEADTSKPVQTKDEEVTAKEKEESSLWKVQSANGASGGGGEIQKLKICRQKPTESPELGETSLRKRLSRSTKDNRSTDDSTHEESEKESKKSKHRSRTSSKNSPLVSPTIVCDVSEGSPTKIKIINVGLINAENKGGNVSKSLNDKSVGEEEKVADSRLGEEKESEANDILDISLPTNEPPLIKPVEVESIKVTEEKDETIVTNIPKTDNEISKPQDKNAGHIENTTKVEKNTSILQNTKSPAINESPKTHNVKSHSSGSSDDGCASAEDSSKPRKVKKKRRNELQSTVQRRMSSSNSVKKESSDSEDDGKKKKEANRRVSTETKANKSSDIKENDAVTSISTTEKNVEENHEQKEQEQPRPMPRKRRWGSSKTKRLEKKPFISISTDSLKCLLPDAKPIPAEELQLSVEEEEGQLDDDDEEDEVVALVAKEEEKQLERDRQKEERDKEKEIEERRKRQERFEKSKPEKAPPSLDKSNKIESTRKIVLLSDDAKKLARSPSPPRHKPTSVLCITHLVRPFTVQQLKNLLLRTGTISENGFWIDKIKSKCYVEYTTEDAAIETRHALHGVRWPTSNPKTLLVEFASHDDLVVAQALTEEPEVPRKSEPLTMVEGWVADQARIRERNRRATVREWDVGKPEHPDEALEFDLKMKEKEKKERESKYKKDRQQHSPTPETEPPARKTRRKEEDAPAKLLDDLFRKTKSSPCIYWLPLSPEQIAVKEEIRRQHMAEHERRMAELKKMEQSRRDRERRTRK